LLGETGSVRRVREMSYPDFIAFVRQDNTPPGGAATVNAWIEMTGLNASARLLDLACSTGFSSRTAVKACGCVAVGIDRSIASIEVARAEARNAGLLSQLTYNVGDAAALPYGHGSFSHVLAGSCFGFIEERTKALTECARILGNGGLICISAFYYLRTPPVALLDRVANAIGYRPDPDRRYEFWRGFFSLAFEPVAERIQELDVLQPALVEAAARELVDRSTSVRTQPADVQQACLHRMVTTRLILNEHRRYQGLSIAVWRKP
jgi:SAM-dependent methyltransferase